MSLRRRVCFWLLLLTLAAVLCLIATDRTSRVDRFDVTTPTAGPAVIWNGEEP